MPCKFSVQLLVYCLVIVTLWLFQLHDAASGADYDDDQIGINLATILREGRGGFGRLGWSEEWGPRGYTVWKGG